MSEQETRRAGVLERVKSGELKQIEAAELLELSSRQTKRLYRRYEEAGLPGWCMAARAGDRIEPNRRSCEDER